MDRGAERPALVLKVDADTKQGTAEGIPPLIDLFGELGVRASWFVTLGPDRSGRALWNLARPGFLAKMFRTGAPGLYGWRTILSGLLLPAPEIGRACRRELSALAAAPGQELGLHGWDHRTWQDRLDVYPAAWARAQIARGIAAFQQLFGRAPACFAAPAWKVSPAAMRCWAEAAPLWQSDCRLLEGDAVPFVPAGGRFASPVPQIPTNAPTLDEIAGRDVDGTRVTASNWPDVYRRGWARRRIVCHTIHVEAEGRASRTRLAGLLRGLAADGWRFLTGGELLAEHAGRLGTGSMAPGSVPGRHGTVAVAAVAR